MTTRTIRIPPFFYPGTDQIAPTTITFELVNASGQSIVGLTELFGIAGKKTVQATNVEQSIELEVNDDILPFSQWQVTILSGLVRQQVSVTVEAWEGSSEEEPMTLSELMYG